MAWDGLRYFIVALPEPSINYFDCLIVDVMAMDGNGCLNVEDFSRLTDLFAC